MGFQYKDELKELLSEYLELLVSNGEIEDRENGYYTCPFCNSGNKQNNTAAFHIIGTSYKCFSCNKRGDIFDLVGYMEKLPTGDFIKHYNRTLKIMRPYLGGNGVTRSESVKMAGVSGKENYTDYLNKCHMYVRETSYFRNRGLSRETIDKFNLGYDTVKNVVTIPYNPDCKGYVHRALWNCDNKYCKHGNGLFNIDALYSHHPANDFFSNGCVFACEGQIDAMSFAEIGLDAVGIGGANETIRLLNQLKERPSSKILILAMDNDDAGRRATGKFICELAESGIKQKYVAISDLYKQYKDANEFLVANRKGFMERMEKIAGHN